MASSGGASSKFRRSMLTRKVENMLAGAILVWLLLTLTLLTILGLMKTEGVLSILALTVS